MSLRGRKFDTISGDMGVLPADIPAYAVPEPRDKLDPGSESEATNDR